MTPDLLEFINFSAKIGSDKNLVQGGGGNTSFKIENNIWIKASGFKLADAIKKNIFVKLNLEKAFIDIANNDAKYALSLNEKCTLKPSIETAFHVLISRKVVIHLHSLNTIKWAVLKEGKKRISNLLNGLNWSWVGYAKPGFDLAELIKQEGTKDIYILQNHGLILTGDSIDQVDSLLNLVEKRLYVKSDFDFKQTTPSNSNIYFKGWSFLNFPEINYLATNPKAMRIFTGGILYPDQVVYLGSYFKVVDLKTKIEDIQKELDSYKDTNFVIVKNVGLLLKKSISDVEIEMLRCSANLISKIQESEEVNYLSESQIYCLVNWDQEKYRKKLLN